MPFLAAIPEVIGTVASAATAASGIASTVQTAEQINNSNQPSQAATNSAASGGSDIGSLLQGIANTIGGGDGGSSPFGTGGLDSSGGGGGQISPQDALGQLQQLNNADEQFQLQLGEEKQRHSEAKAALSAIGN